jgi:hypothetical protein
VPGDKDTKQTADDEVTIEFKIPKIGQSMSKLFDTFYGRSREGYDLEFAKLGISSKFSSPKWDYWQTLLSRGDERLTDFMINVYKNGGKNGAYKFAFKSLSEDQMKALNGFEFNEEFPWEIIENYPTKQLLINEYNRLSKQLGE